VVKLASVLGAKDKSETYSNHNGLATNPENILLEQNQ